jgi:hypothetical protein
MFNKKYILAVLFISILLILGLTIPACTCQRPAEIEEPSAPLGQPPEEEGASAPPGQPPETEEPSAPPEQPVTLSFRAAEYANSELGFSVKYPEDWQETDEISGPGILFVAASPGRVPILIISVAEGLTLADAVKVVVQAAGGSDVKIKSQSETTLADGTTEATQGRGTFKHPMAPMAIDAFVLGVKKDNKWIIVTVATVGLLAKFDEAKFSEIAHTLEFK